MPTDDIHRRSTLPNDQFQAVRRLLGPDDTSVIVTDLEVLDSQLDHLVKTFPTSCRHAIAIKTMPHPMMLRELVLRGFSLEAASFEEVMLALEAGAEPSAIVFDSPAKTEREIHLCHELHAGMLLNANSLAELDRIPPNPSFRLGLRINPEIRSDAPKIFRVSSEGSRFGVPHSRRDAILAAALEHPISALHVHVGSQVADVDVQVESLRLLVALADDIDAARARIGSSMRIESIDIGGGWLADEAPARDLRTTRVTELVENLKAEVPSLFERQVTTEPGQWVHTHAGWTASRVEYTEISPRAFAVLHVGADLFVRDVYGTSREFPFELQRSSNQVSTTPSVAYDLDGPLCFAGDLVARGVVLPEIEIGDWLIIRETGANTLGLWSRHCSRSIPAVVALRGNAATLWSPRRPVS